jgi:hypothetical protein
MLSTVECWATTTKNSTPTQTKEDRLTSGKISGELIITWCSIRCRKFFCHGSLHSMSLLRPYTIEAYSTNHMILLRMLFSKWFYQTRSRQIRPPKGVIMVLLANRRHDADSTTDLLRHFSIEETKNSINAGKQKYEWLWDCHQCGKSGNMLVGITLQCVMFPCDHLRCIYCPAYRLQTRKGKDIILVETPVTALTPSPFKLMRYAMSTNLSVN